ncbi:MAG: FG-GAP repeat protein [Candidatus Midichloria sp.]|nr:FG-GAP repeat protein [Candidatus Midichloria sp.]
MMRKITWDGLLVPGTFNGDGRNDIVVGVHGGDPADRTDAGRVYVIFGGTLLFFDLTIKNTTTQWQVMALMFMVLVKVIC